MNGRLSFTRPQNINSSDGIPLTCGFVQVGQDFVTSAMCKHPAVVSA